MSWRSPTATASPTTEPSLTHKIPDGPSAHEEMILSVDTCQRMGAGPPAPHDHVERRAVPGLVSGRPGPTATTGAGARHGLDRRRLPGFGRLAAGIGVAAASGHA